MSRTQHDTSTYNSWDRDKWVRSC